MSADRLFAPLDVDSQRAIRDERQRCADIALFYPLEKFAYDCANTGELLRLRDAISEAILKGSSVGQMIK